MNNLVKVGGYLSSLVLVLLGVVLIAVGFIGRGEVQDRLAQENIVATPDSEIPNESVDTGSEAKKFADTIREHTLQATGGKTYAEMPRAVYEENNEPVPEEEADQALASGEAINNPERQIWVTSTALTTALNTSFFAESVATFTIVVGFALLLIGIGLLLLTRAVARHVGRHTHDGERISAK
jgi:cytoskeletal protein RodZ